jgi:hypothetical protein
LLDATTGSNNYGYDLLYLYVPKLKNIYTGLITGAGNYNLFVNIKEVNLPVFEELNLKTATTPLIGSNRHDMHCFESLERVILPSLKRITRGVLLNGVNGALFTNLIDVEVGALESSLNLKPWQAATVRADSTKRAQLIDNIKNHILAKVSDATGSTQLVFTVSTAMYNDIATENITWNGQTMTLADAFLTKNWLLAGA